MNTPLPPLTLDSAALWVPLAVIGGLAVVAVVLAVVVVLRFRRARQVADEVPADEAQAPADGPRRHELTSENTDEDATADSSFRRRSRRPATPRPRRSRDEVMATVRTTAAPVVLGGVVLWLVFDGLESFAQESMGLLPPMSYAVIVAFEFVAMWLCWERFARAQDGKPDVFGLAAGQWVLLAMAMLFQFDHAVHDDLSAVGTVARVALPAILGGVVEWALHSRRTTVRVQDDEDRGRLFDHSLKSNPVLYLRARYAMAAHPAWTAEDAVQHIRTQDAKTLALRLRDLITNPPTAPTAPAPVDDPTPPFIPAGASDRARDRVQRNFERAQDRAENTRTRRARDHEAAQARHRRAVRRHENEVGRLRDRLVDALDALGFIGDPTDTPAADMLRAVQVGVLVDDMVTLDYANPDEAARWFGGLITGGDLEAARVDRPALEGAAASTPAASSTPGVDEGTAPASTPTADRVDVHTASTLPSTPTPGGRVDEAPARVDHRVDADPADEAPAALADPAPAPSSTPHEAPRVDEVDAVPADDADRVDVHTGGVWTAPLVHTDGPADEADEVPARVDADADEAAPALVPAPASATDGDDEGPDDDGDGPRGGGAPAPAPAGVTAGQTRVDDALAQVAAPSALDVARVALDAPVWDEASTKKAQIMALLWETHGDVTAVRSAYADRTGTDVPRDLYRQGPRGYSWAWHHEVTTYLISRSGHADEVRATLAAAGVDHTHEAVTAALDAWSDTNGSQVIQFRRVPQGS